MHSKTHSLLRQAKKIIEKHDAIEQAVGGKFNIFTLLDRERDEVKTHSLFIYDFINPHGSHAQGDRYLRLFAEKVLKIDSFEPTNLRIKREDPTDENRRIDFTIQNNDYFIAIEMKIDAPDQPKQLVDYKKQIQKSKKEAKLYYLTLDGKEANETSTHDKGKPVDYERISFAMDIREWIEACIAHSATLPMIRETLVQYAKLLRKLTHQNEVTMDTELIDLLLTDGNLATAEKIKNALPDARAQLELRFWRKLETQLRKKVKKYGFEMREFTDDKLIDKLKGRKKYGDSFVEFYHPRQYRGGNYFNFAVAVDGYASQLYIVYLPADKNWEYLSDNDCEKSLKALKKPLKNEHYEYFGQKRDFYGDGLLKLIDPTQCDTMVQETLEEVIPFLKLFQERIDAYFHTMNPTNG